MTSGGAFDLGYVLFGLCGHEARHGPARGGNPRPVQVGSNRRARGRLRGRDGSAPNRLLRNPSVLPYPSRIGFSDHFGVLRRVVALRLEHSDLRVSNDQRAKAAGVDLIDSLEKC